MRIRSRLTKVMWLTQGHTLSGKDRTESQGLALPSRCPLIKAEGAYEWFPGKNSENRYWLLYSKYWDFFKERKLCFEQWLGLFNLACKELQTWNAKNVTTSTQITLDSEEKRSLCSLNIIKAPARTCLLTSKHIKNGVAQGPVLDPLLVQTVISDLDAATAYSWSSQMRLNLKWRLTPRGMRLELEMTSTDWTSNQKLTGWSSVKTRAKGNRGLRENKDKKSLRHGNGRSGWELPKDAWATEAWK